MKESIYKINSVKHFYAGKPVLEIDDLEIEKGAIIGLSGPNGSGKSTFLRLLGLIERPVKGQILYNGKRVHPFSDDARFQITLMSQEPFLMKRSVFKNIAYGLKLRKVSDNVSGLAQQAMEMVGLSYEAYFRRPWYALSVGEAQRVCLAARLVLRPKVLLLDEPTASVDATSAQLIRKAAVKARQDWNTTLMIASHDRQWLYDVCDHVLNLYQGKIIGSENQNVVSGPWEDLGNGFWGKKAGEDTELRMPAPPDRDASAIFKIFLKGQSDQEQGCFELKGTIMRLNLDKNLGKVFVSVRIGDLSLDMTLTREQAQQQKLFPGKIAEICYRPEEVKWISSGSGREFIPV